MTVDAARFRAASRYDDEFTKFDVTVHRDKYDKAAVSWNYPSYYRQPDKWQVTMHKFLYDNMQRLTRHNCIPCINIVIGPPTHSVCQYCFARYRLSSRL